MKVERVLGEAAYVLHTWPYRETSSIVDVLSEQHGRVRLVARAVKRAKGGHALRPFNRLALSWSGRDELKSLHRHELVRHRWLQGEALFAGLYANEITLRALRRHKPEESLFSAYEEMLEGLAEASAGDDLEPPLRRYERSLLTAIGYGLNLQVDSEGKALAPDGWYQFDVASGLVPAARAENAFSGAALIAIDAGELDQQAVRRAAKRLMRVALASHIGPAPLMSRGLHE